MKHVLKPIVCFAICFCLLFSVFPLPAVAKEETLPSESVGIGICGIQVSLAPDTVNKVTTLRFLGALDDCLKEYSRVGFLIRTVWKDEKGNVRYRAKSIDYGTSTVYLSVRSTKGNGEYETVPAAAFNARYLLAIVVENIPIGEGVQADVTVTPYSVPSNEAAAKNRSNYTFYEKNARTFSFINGEYNTRADPLSGEPIQMLTVAGADISSYRIVYDASEYSYHSNARAVELRDLIAEVSGVMLSVFPDTVGEKEKEILIGETNRAESVSAVAAFERPNRYWLATVSGTKLIIANQGVRSGEAMLAAVRAWFEAVTTVSCNMTSESFCLSGDILSADADGSMARAAGTDVRMMQSNIYGVYRAGDPYQQRAELLVDTYLVYYPDVIALNEMFRRSYHQLTPVVERLLSRYYTIVEAEYLGIFPDPEEITSSNQLIPERKYAVPVAYRKDAGLTLLDSGFTYLSNMKEDYHGVSWAVFQTVEGNRFLAASVHLCENVVIDANGNKVHSSVWVEDVLKAVKVAQDRYGNLPVALGGDWYFGQSYYATAYNYMIAQGYADVSENAIVPYSVGVGTCHDLGVEQTNRSEIDLIFTNPEWFRTLAHKIIVDDCTTNSSDHYPIFADLQFTKPATEDDIPNKGPLRTKESGDAKCMSFAEFVF